jgi:hypothetical protein
MKKIILTAAAVFAFSFANAQDMKLGVKGGLNSSTLSGVDGAKSLIGLNIGGFVEFKVSDKFSVQPELLYSMQGVKTDMTLKLNYINIPVIAKYAVAEKFNLQAGPQIGFLVSANQDGVDYKDHLKSIDFGINFGAGYDFTKKMFLDLRYNLGLAQTQKSLDPGEAIAKNAVIQLSLGYKF